MQKYIYRATGDVLRLMTEDYQEAAMFVGKNGKGIQRIINKGMVKMADQWMKDQILPLYSPETARAYEQALEEVS